MSLSITSTHARIGIQTSPSKLEMESSMAKLEHKQNHAKMKIETDLPKVKIDQYEAFASAGLKNLLDLTKENAQIGHQQAMEYISKKASDGDQMAEIHLGGNPIAEFALRDSYTEREFNIDFIPKARPEITVEGDIRIELEGDVEAVAKSVETSYIPENLNINYIPSNVNIYMEQYASLNIEYRGKNINEYV
ncbi:UNVERIFIED_CONTAM: hypothetical protein Cloal_1418 [Acetivibrio alkalicellulosi]